MTWGPGLFREVLETFAEASALRYVGGDTSRLPRDEGVSMFIFDQEAITERSRERSRRYRQAHATDPQWRAKRAAYARAAYARAHGKEVVQCAP